MPKWVHKVRNNVRLARSVTLSRIGDCIPREEMPMSGADERVSELLLEWEDRLARGEAVEATDLCRDTPDLVPELRRRIDAVQALGRLVHPAGSAATPPAGSTVSWLPAASDDILLSGP